MKPETKALIEQIKIFELWRKSSQQYALEQKTDYPHWLDFSKAFANLLCDIKKSDRTSDDEQALRVVCRLSEAERVELLIHPYPDLGERMFMLVQARSCKAIQTEVCLCFFENDPNEAIRDEALIGLASAKWPYAEDHALKLWKSQKTVNRMVALDCLNALNSPLLSEYLEKAAKSRDGNVRRSALAISSIRDIDKMNWPLNT